MIRRISLLSGPCSGKSTVAADMYSRLKRQGYNIELVTEYAKDWAYEGRTINEYDQLELYSTQLAREYRVLKSNENVVIITDSPTLLAIPYAIRYNFPCIESLEIIEDQFEKEFPSINIFLERGNCPYTQAGRYEDHKRAKQMDNMIKNYLEVNLRSFIELPYDNYDEIYNIILDFLGGRK